MGVQTTNGSRFRFGVFELDLRTGELRKNGTITNLPHQPCKILTLLVSQPGELVTREEIKEQIWGNDTFVDFENGLNSAIKRIRTVLGDDSESPRYIETLPRRGYRFIAPLEKVNETPPTVNATVPTGFVSEPSVNSGNGESLPMATTPPSLVLSGVDIAVAAGPVTGKESAAPPQTKSRALWRWLSAIAAIGVLAGVFAFWRRIPLPPPKVLAYRQLTDDRRNKAQVLVSEGQQLYFSEDAGNNQWTLAMVSTQGGPTITLPTSLKSAFLEDMSPDGTELLVTDRSSPADEYPFYVVPVVGHAARRLGDAMGHCGGWLADGKVLYANGSSLYTVNLDGTDPRKLVTAQGKMWWPRSSLDGRVVRFVIREPSGTSLWEVAADGSHLHPLLPGWNVPPSEWGFNWTADGKYFVFDSLRNGRQNIWAIREEAGLFQKIDHAPMRLTAGPIEFGYPLPSRDGSKLFARGTIYHGEPVRYDLKARQFVPYFSGVPAVMLDFDKTGERVIYVSDHDWSLWRSKADGSERVQLTFPPMRTMLPRWAPDGKQIAFAGQLSEKPLSIYLISPEGGLPQQITNSADDLSDADWSADSNVLVYASARYRLYDHTKVEKADVLGIQMLDLRTRKVSTLPGSRGLSRPRWSPDGRYIAALSADSQRLMLYDFTTRKWAELARLDIGNPTWSHDGKYIYFDRTIPHGEPAFFRIKVNDRKLEQVVAKKGVEQYGWWTGLTPDDSPLMIRDISTYEVYALDWEAP